MHDAATEALAEEKVWSILEDSEGALWFGTRSHGLFRYQDGKITTFTTAQGLATNSIYQLLDDHHGSLWLSGPTTISSFPFPTQEPDVGEMHLKVNVYELPYDTDPSADVRRPSTRRLRRPRRRPVVRQQPRSSARSASTAAPHVAPPRALLTGIKADGRELPLASSLVFPASLSRLEISFAPLLLRSQEDVRFRYRLEDFDQDWIYAGTNRVASYTNLPAGQVSIPRGGV